MNIDLNEKSSFVNLEKLGFDTFKFQVLKDKQEFFFNESAREELILALFAIGNNELAELQKEIAPDYPIEARNTLYDYVGAIRAAYQGCLMANDDLHKVIKTLTEGKTPEERYKIYLYAEQNANLIEENLKLQKEIDGLEAELRF